MSWFLAILFLGVLFNSPSEARHEKKLPSAVVIGTVYCDTCFQDDFSKASHFIPGAKVAVECKYGTSKSSFREEVKTDEHGEFKVPLPFSVSKHVKTIEGCSVKLISSSEPYCAVASTATSSSLHLKSRKQGTHIFSAGFFTFKPLKQPNLCNKKPSIQNSKGLSYKKVLIPPNLPSGNHNFIPPQFQDQKANSPDSIFPNLFPPNPFQPPPLLPNPNPLQPPPLLPNPLQPPPLLPNPLQPPPLLPNPLQPPPAPLIPLPPVPGLTPSPPPPLIPNPFKPPIVPLIPLPPIPGLTPSPPPPLLPNPFNPPTAPSIPWLPIPGFTPSPPPPPIPSLPFPFPPNFPFPPSPRVPGIPPASSSKP